MNPFSQAGPIDCRKTRPEVGDRNDIFCSVMRLKLQLLILG